MLATITFYTLAMAYYFIWYCIIYSKFRSYSYRSDKENMAVVNYKLYMYKILNVYMYIQDFIIVVQLIFRKQIKVEILGGISCFIMLISIFHLFYRYNKREL